MIDLALALDALTSDVRDGYAGPALDVVRRLSALALRQRDLETVGGSVLTCEIEDLLLVVDDYERAGGLTARSVAAVSEYLQGIDAEPMPTLEEIGL